ncbi:MAG: tRNA pseudouridine(55) synthase TruB [Lactobacillaceae bacterium]|jgi:tRNA pseudouridine55 synthase|nr:tRNA pseudouridine(55) synthase TruB [Lactobacillaceae bacterium]
MSSELNGILLVNKPKGITSFDVVRQIRKIVHQKSVGHTGTLDPDVDGLMVIVLGAATKLIDFLQNHPKTYIGTGLIGISTQTEDISGVVVEEKSVILNQERLDSAIENMNGKYIQTPPMFSAVKVNGKRLYEYARQGLVIDSPSREVYIYNFKRTSAINLDSDNHVSFDFSATVSKGTYIRTLIVDLATKLGYPGTMSNLRRTSADGYSLEEAHYLNFFDEENIASLIIPLELVLSELPKVELNDSQFNKVKNGAFLELDIADPEVVLLFENKVKAIYERVKNYYKPKTMFLGND